MQINLMLEPQEGMSYAQLLAFARAAEEHGLAGLYRSDHYVSVTGREALPSTDAWGTLAALARETSRITLGTLVTPVTFRTVGNLAKVVATTAELAGTVDGAPRVHLGLGTGWLEEEHRQFGFPFEAIGTRFDRLEEHLAVVHGLLTSGGEPFTFEGRHARLRGTRLVPVPDPRLRLIVGGRGRRRTPRLAARFADELNVVFTTPQETAELHRALDDAARAQDRDPASLQFSLMTGVLVGRTPAEFRERAGRFHAELGHGDLDGWLDGLRGAWVLGTVDEARARLRELADDAGVQRVMLQHQLHDDLDAVAVLAELA